MNIEHPKSLELLPVDNLQEKLYELSNEIIENDSVQHRAIIQSMIINQILLLRFSASQELRNSRIQWLPLIVAAMAVVPSLISIFK
jgi:hypothetical protein